MSSSASDSTPPQLVNIRDDDVCSADDSQFKILITVHLWSMWLEVAVEQAEEARRARGEMTRLRSEGKEFAALLGSEFQASVVAIAASAHALDALYGLTVIPENARGSRPEPPRQDPRSLEAGIQHWPGQQALGRRIRLAIRSTRPGHPCRGEACGTRTAPRRGEHRTRARPLLGGVSRAGRGLCLVGLPVVCGPPAARRGKLGNCDASVCC